MRVDPAIYFNVISNNTTKHGDLVNFSLSLIFSYLQDHLQKLLAEGWGYAPLFNMKFHAKEKKLDFVRRRRWLLKMVPSSGKIDGFSCTLPPVLRIQLKSKVIVTKHYCQRTDSLYSSPYISYNVYWENLFIHPAHLLFGVKSFLVTFVLILIENSMLLPKTEAHSLLRALCPKPYAPYPLGPYHMSRTPCLMLRCPVKIPHRCF